ncbi:MAG: hypothetical protein ACFHWX_01180 [Bacteroidota bacterium]
MIVRQESIKRGIIAFFSTLGVYVLFHIILLTIDWDFPQILHSNIDSSNFFIDFAPEIWFTLLGLVLGTLILVISIASQSNPKLIDYYTSDYPSLFYSCFITIAGVENIFLQLNLSIYSVFYNNVTFINVFVLMPLAVLNIIPYAFYILSYAKTSSLIQTITRANQRMIVNSFGQVKKKHVEKIQFHLLETINQLDDQHGYVRYKEPKSEIIHSLGEMIRFYLTNKEKVNPLIFNLTWTIKQDISFRTLIDEFEAIEKSGTFLEHKVFKVLSGIYLQLIAQDYHDLAALCCHELGQIGRVAHTTKNFKILELCLIQFNTLLRFGIRHATQHTDVRHVFNAVFHYTQLILFLVKNNQGAKVKQCCQYLTYYGKEIYKLSLNYPHFIFLIDSFASEIQRILILMNQYSYPKKIQMEVLQIYATIEPTIQEAYLDRARNNNARSVKIALILFYLHKKESEFVEELILDIIDDLRYFESGEVLEIIKKDCFFLQDSKPNFWEFSDRGDNNIYFTPFKNHLNEFYKLFKQRLHSIRVRD